MARTAGSDGERTLAAIREQALTLIARRGYEAVTMRELAAAVGVQAAALYRYFPTKEDLLFSLMDEHMRALIASWEAERPIGGGASAQLAAFVRHHVAFHVGRRHSTHVSNMELRALSSDKLSLILKMRASYEKDLRRILRDGADSGELAVDDVALTAMAIIQMITGVIVWFRPDERLSVDDIAETYTAMTMRLAGARTGGAPDHVSPRDVLRTA